MKTIRVLLADDHALFRAGLRALLQKVPEVEIVAEAGDGHEALRLIDLYRPRVVLMDIMMPRLNGLEATARSSSKFPQTRTVILSMNDGKEFVLQALQAGAAGYLLKDNSPTELEQAVRAVARGETYLSSAIAKHVVDACVPHLQRTATSPTPLAPRLREILQLIAEGHTTKSIAQKLALTTKTVESYRVELMDILDIHDIAGLVRYAIRMGIISPDW
jgi:DNA-binding NarL/FixJ family response regulator